MPSGRRPGDIVEGWRSCRVCLPSVRDQLPGATWESGGLSHNRWGDGLRRDLVLRVVTRAVATNRRTQLASAARLRLFG